MSLGIGTDALRLVHDAADGVADVLVDRYGDIVRVELYDERLAPQADAIADAVERAVGPLAGVLLLVRGARGKGQMRTLRGAVPVQHVVHEDDLRYLVRCAEEDAPGTGIFVDQREGRRLVRAASHGRPALNLFAHAGGFGAAAAAGGASRVDHVDAARKCAPWAALNLALNGIDPREHRFLVDDAFRILRRAAERGPAYGVIVCDPPTTALDPRGKRFRARERLAEMAEQACRALLEDGALLLSTNDRSVPVAQVMAEVRAGAAAAGRALLQLDEVPMPPDIPPGDDPRLRPMRGVWARIR
jgi:23S rRNA (cytosine1962-C5)-methyltransferase